MDKQVEGLHGGPFETATTVLRPPPIAVSNQPPAFPGVWKRHARQKNGYPSYFGHDPEIDFWNSQFGGAVVGGLFGAGTAALGFIVAEVWRKISDRKAEIKKAISKLELTRMEVHSYVSILKILKASLDKLAADFDQHFEGVKHGKFTGPAPILPSFSIYPELLGSLRVDVAEICEDAKLTAEVSSCHYELAHVGERLDRLKERYFGNNPIYPTEGAYVRNVAELATTTITKFELLEQLLLGEINTQRRRLCVENFPA